MDISAVIGRVMRVVRFDSSVFREIAADATALPQALLVVVVAAILSGLGKFGDLGSAGLIATLIGVVLGIVGVLIGFAVYAAVASFVARQFFQGKTDFQEMARTLGFAYVWNGLGVLAIIPFLGGIIAFIASILAVVSGVLALRESAEFDTTKAVITAVIAGVVATFALVCTTTIIATPIILALAAAGGGQ